MIARGYTNISTGTHQATMVLRPKLAMPKEIRQNRIAQTEYLGPLGNICTKASAQLVTRPMAVFRQAKVTMAAVRMPPARRK